MTGNTGQCHQAALNRNFVNFLTNILEHFFLARNFTKDICINIPMFDQAKIYSNAGSTVHMYNFNLDLEYDWLTTRELTEVNFKRKNPYSGRF